MVVPLLDGRSVAEVVTALAGRASAAEVVFVIATLERKGHVVSATSLGSAPVDAFWHALGSRLATVDDGRVRIVGYVGAANEQVAELVLRR